MTFFAVARRINVAAASKYEAVDGVEYRPGRISVGKRWYDEWYEPCTLEGVHVSGG
jgi:hypothetical protein